MSQLDQKTQNNPLQDQPAREQQRYRDLTHKQMLKLDMVKQEISRIASVHQLTAEAAESRVLM